MDLVITEDLKDTVTVLHKVETGNYTTENMDNNEIGCMVLVIIGVMAYWIMFIRYLSRRN